MRLVQPRSHPGVWPDVHPNTVGRGSSCGVLAARVVENVLNGEFGKRDM